MKKKECHKFPFWFFHWYTGGQSISKTHLDDFLLMKPNQNGIKGYRARDAACA